MELILSCIERIAAERPLGTAIVDGDHSLSYGDLVSQVRRLASGLSALGVARGDVGATILPDSIESVVTHLALMRLGAITAPVLPGQSSRDLSARFAELNPRVVIGTPEALRTLAESDPSPVRVVVNNDSSGGPRFEELLAHDDDTTTEGVADETACATLLYTSGVGGMPSAVELSHESLTHQSHQVGRALRLRPGDRIAGAHSFSSIFGLTLGVHLPLVHGAAIILTKGTQGILNLDVLRESDVTMFVGSPRVFEKWLTGDSAGMNEPKSLRYLLCCDGRLNPEIGRLVEEKIHRPVMCSYGSTETCGIVTLNLFPDEEHRTTEGEPLGDAEIAILDEDGNRLGAGKAGRIAVRGKMLMRGYWKSPDRTASVLRDGWLHTDDYGSMDFHSHLSVEAHSTAHFTKGGFPVYAWEAEEVLRSLSGVRDAAVIGVADQVYGIELKACVVPAEGVMLSAGDVIDYLKTRLPIYKCPRIVKFYKELPRTPGGKIRRAALLDDRL